LTTTARISASAVPAHGQPVAQHRLCPVCGAARAMLLHTQQLVLPAEFALPQIFDIVTCGACGMAYSDTTAEAERLTAHYRGESYSMHNWEDRRPADATEPTLGSPVDTARLRVVAQQLAHALPKRDLRILDVGCASGTLLALLQETGFTDVQGVDPSPSAVAAARRLGQRAQVGDLDTPLRSEFGSFDVVIISHVLEHLGRPRAALDHVRQALRPDGVVYAEVPDAARYAAFLAEPFVDFNHEHVNHFSLAHLDELFRAAGFAAMLSSEKLITVVNWPYPVVYGLWRRLDRVPEPGVAPALAGVALRERLAAYVAGSHDLLASYDRILTAKLGTRRRVAVRCLGYRAWTLLAGTRLRELDIVAYIDNAPEKRGLTVRGIHITGPEAPLEAGIPVVVLAFHVEAAVVAGYAAADPAREVITLGRSQPVRESAGRLDP
jgi:SAM-dependent methyltransferase